MSASPNIGIFAVVGGVRSIEVHQVIVLDMLGGGKPMEAKARGSRSELHSIDLHKPLFVVDLPLEIDLLGRLRTGICSMASCTVFRSLFHQVWRHTAL